MLEERGIPATVVITEPFQTIIASHAAKLGAPGFHSIVVPHPIYGKTDEEIRAIAVTMVDRALMQLTPQVKEDPVA